MFNTHGNSAGSEVRFSGKSARIRTRRSLLVPLLWLLSATLAALMTFACASPVANLQISAPASAVAGSPLSVTVTAMVNGQRDTIFNSYIQFTSSDSAAILPDDYRFTASDAGSHTFTDGITLMTVGNQSITASEVAAHSITGTTNVTVSAATTALQGTVNVQSTTVDSTLGTPPWQAK